MTGTLNNLGRQTYNEFQQYISPYNAYKFTDEYKVQHLRRNTIDPASRVCITNAEPGGRPQRSPGCWST